MLLRKLMLAAAAITACSSAIAQDAAIAPAGPAAVPVTISQATDPAACELHIWPAERFNSMTTGLLLGGLLDAAVHANTDKNNRTQIASALDSQSQSDALSGMDLAGLLKVKPAKLVVHDTPLDRHTVNDIKTRRSDSQVGCYSELIVADLFYQKTAIYGRTLRALFIYRDFGAAPTVAHVYKNWGGNGLKLFPAKPGEDVTAANNELVSVFKADFEEFARNEVSAQPAH